MTIADVVARLTAIVQGRGADGSLGAAAQARAVAVERFRVTSTPDPSQLDASAFDRAVNITISNLRDDPPRNVQSPLVQQAAVIELRIAYVAAPSLSGMVHGEADDAARAIAVARWVARAHEDVQELDRALTWYELTGNDTNPVIERVAPLGETATTDAGNGRGLMVRRYEIVMEKTNP